MYVFDLCESYNGHIIILYMNYMFIVEVAVSGSVVLDSYYSNYVETSSYYSSSIMFVNEME